MRKPRVAVLGAGWAGLAAAVELARAGVPVTVFESSRQPGGRARTVRLQGLALDNGQHILLGAYRHTLALLERVNPNWRAHLERLPLQLTMEPGFRLRTPRLPAPWHLILALLRAEGLAWRDRSAALRLFAGLRSRRFQLGSDRPLTRFLAETRQTARLERFLWHPLCLAALNTPPGSASAQVFVNVLHDALARRREDSDLLLPRVDLSTLFPLPAAAFIVRHGGHLRLGERVLALNQAGGGWQVKTSQGAETFHHVVCALPPKATATLLATVEGMQELARQWAAWPHQAIHTVYLQYPHRLQLPEPMLGLAAGPGQWVFDRERLAGQAGLLAVVISAADPHEHRDPAVLGQAVARQLAETLGITQKPRWTRVIAEKRATFACSVDLPRPACRTPLPGLLLAGDFVAAGPEERDYPATLEGAVRSGVQCARHLLKAQ